MNDTMSKYVEGCVMFATRKPFNIKLRFYIPLLVLSRPWKRVSMDFGGGLPMSRK